MNWYMDGITCEKNVNIAVRTEGREKTWVGEKLRIGEEGGRL